MLAYVFNNNTLALLTKVIAACSDEAKANTSIGPM
jgi:hypothetical protein